MRDAQLVMSHRVRHPVLSGQRHSVTEFRQTDGMTVGQRIQQRLKEPRKNVPWLARQTGIPATTLYDLIRGDIKSTPRLPSIAAALGLHALWLELGVGPRLLKDASPSQPQAAHEWPFSFPRERWDRLSPAQQKRIEEVVEGMILAFESSGISSHQKSRWRAASG